MTHFIVVATVEALIGLGLLVICIVQLHAGVKWIGLFSWLTEKPGCTACEQYATSSWKTGPLRTKCPEPIETNWWRHRRHVTCQVFSASHQWSRLHYTGLNEVWALAFLLLSFNFSGFSASPHPRYQHVARYGARICFLEVSSIIRWMSCREA